MAVKNNLSFDAVLARFNSNLWHFHIVVPKSVVKQFLHKKSMRVVCTLNRKVSFQCAILSAGGGIHFITINKKLRDQLQLKEGSKVSATLAEDKSTYGLPMPEEFKEVLKQDPEGNQLFHALTPGKQRTLLYIANSPKNADARIQQALIILKHLQQNDGKVDYKVLYQMLKEK